MLMNDDKTDRDSHTLIIAHLIVRKTVNILFLSISEEGIECGGKANGSLNTYVEDGEVDGELQDGHEGDLAPGPRVELEFRQRYDQHQRP